MIQASFRCRGFTFLELAVITVISGLLLAASLRIYDAYLADRYAHETAEKLRVIDSSLAFYIGTQGRLPCPSNPTIPVIDPNAGREIPLASCVTLRDPLTAVGTCLDGVCKVDGVRDTDADADATNDPVLVGGVPFVELQIHGGSNVAQGDTLYNSVDPWGFQFTYAVSGYLTTTGTYRSSRGVIDVRTEPTPSFPRPGPANPNDPLQAVLGGQSLVDPPGSSQYVVIGHGPNHVGAYSADGRVPVPCNGAQYQDVDNCDTNPVVATYASFTAGIRRDTSVVSGGFSYNKFDDQLKYNSFALSTLWEFVGSDGSIHNTNPGYVGMGTATPLQQLDVVGDVQTQNVQSLTVCDQANWTACFSPEYLSAPAASGNSMHCPASVDPTKYNVVTGLTWDAVSVPPKPVPVCSLVPKISPYANQACGLDPVTGGQTYVSGFDNTGKIICTLP